MIGQNHFGWLRLGEIDVQFLFVYPLWSYTENYMMIHQHSAEICEFQSKCLTISSQEIQESRKSRRLIIMFCLVATIG